MNEGTNEMENGEFKASLYTVPSKKTALIDGCLGTAQTVYATGNRRRSSSRERARKVMARSAMRL